MKHGMAVAPSHSAKAQHSAGSMCSLLLALPYGCRDYAGHASHVMMVRFAPNNRWLVSVGGRDRAVFQWRLVRQVQDEAPPRREPTAAVFHYGLNRAAQDGASDASLAARPAPVVQPAVAAAPPAPRQQPVRAAAVPALLLLLLHACRSALWPERCPCCRVLALLR
jgi:hypothetical protein